MNSRSQGRASTQMMMVMMMSGMVLAQKLTLVCLSRVRRRLGARGGQTKALPHHFLKGEMKRCAAFELSWNDVAFDPSRPSV